MCCSGLSVVGGRARLDPGVYVIEDGQLNVAKRLGGEKMRFTLTGRSSTELFQCIVTVSLTAPHDGHMPGQLFLVDYGMRFARHDQIASIEVRDLVGRRYLPNSKLMRDARTLAADKWGCTVIIAREFELRDGPGLVLNTDCEASHIALPRGVANKLTPDTRLVE